MDSNSPERPTPPPQEGSRFTRRSFLKKLAIGVGVFAGAALLKDVRQPKLEPEQKEQLKQLSPHVVMVDFAPNGPREKINQIDFPQETELIKALAGKEYVDEQRLKDEFGEDFRTNKDKQDELFKRYSKMAIMYSALDRFGSHGEHVALTMQASWQRAGYESSVSIISLQNALNTSQVEFTQDELGNKGYFLNVNPSRIIESLKQYPQQKIVNFSFQVGKVGFFVMEREKRDKNVQWDMDLISEDENGNELVYVGAKGIKVEADGRKVGITGTSEPVNPMTQEQYEDFRKKRAEEAKEVVNTEHPYASIKGAYSKEDVEANLPKLFEVCNAFPDKLFFAAAGNEGEDLRAIVNRPANLLMVAEWDGEEQKPQHKVHGADLYINNSALYLSGGSSFSTPVVSAFASILLNKGLDMEQIRTRLRAATETVSYNINGIQEKTKLFDPNKLKI